MIHSCTTHQLDKIKWSSYDMNGLTGSSRSPPLEGDGVPELEAGIRCYRNPSCCEIHVRVPEFGQFGGDHSLF